MIFFGGVFRLGEGDDGEQEAEEEGDGKDEVEEGLQDDVADAEDPESAGAGEEELGDEAVEDEDEEDELKERW